MKFVVFWNNDVIQRRVFREVNSTLYWKHNNLFFNILKIQNNLHTTKYIMIICGLFEHASMLFRGLFQCPKKNSRGLRNHCETPRYLT